MVIDFSLPAELEAHDPPEARGLARDGVRMLVSRRSSGEIGQHGFRDLPGLLLPGDLLVVNTTATLPAQVRAAEERARPGDGSTPPSPPRRAASVEGELRGRPHREEQRLLDAYQARRSIWGNSSEGVNRSLDVARCSRYSAIKSSGSTPSTEKPAKEVWADQRAFCERVRSPR